jgi:hypothetical protein
MTTQALAIISIACMALGCAYRPGTFSDGTGKFPGVAATLGCIDLAVARVADAQKPGPVLQFSFGNRCTHAVTIDLAAVLVDAHDDSGWERELVAYDPRGEIRPLAIDAGLTGREQIEYRDPYRPFIDARTLSICVDVARVDRSALGNKRELCVDQGPQP